MKPHVSVITLGVREVDTARARRERQRGAKSE